jgi:recombination protein RecT
MSEEKKDLIPEYAKPVFKAKENFVKVAGEDKWVREAGFATQYLMDSEMLRKCEVGSIHRAVLNVALTGITLNPALKQAYLIPRDGKCCLDFSYRGLIKVAVDSGAVVSINANVVYEWDDFDYEEGTEPHIHYKQNLNPPMDPEKLNEKLMDHVICAFSMAVLPSGQRDFVILPKWRLLKIRDTSKSKGSNYSPWQKWPEEMIRKTAIKYHSKTLQGFARNDNLATAVELSNEIDGIDLDAQRKARAADLESRFSEAEMPKAEEIFKDEVKK